MSLGGIKICITSTIFCFYNVSIKDMAKADYLFISELSLKDVLPSSVWFVDFSFPNHLITGCLINIL